MTTGPVFCYNSRMRKLEDLRLKYAFVDLADMLSHFAGVMEQLDKVEFKTHSYASNVDDRGIEVFTLTYSGGGSLNTDYFSFTWEEFEEVIKRVV